MRPLGWVPGRHTVLFTTGDRLAMPIEFDVDGSARAAPLARPVKS
ncbi:MAG: hypothetical protein R2762_26265 [Bryobacteraceae bacterium]